MTYRYCDRPKTRTVGGTCTSTTYGSTYTSKYVSDVYEETPTCGEWKNKQIPDEVNFRAFYDDDFFGWEKDFSCGSRGSGSYLGTYCSKVTGSPDHAALVYSKAGTVCFRYTYEVCSDVDSYCWGTSGDGCDREGCETKCYSLDDTSQIHTLAIYTFGDTPVYYVEIAFNNKDVSNDGNNKSSKSAGMKSMSAGYITLCLVSLSYLFLSYS